MLNRYYNSLGPDARSSFHARYAKVFRNRGISLSAGEWTVKFMNREIRLPLRSSWSWLDWDTAVSILGHDIEVKETYATLIKSSRRPSVFLDVGANYGIHSLLFLSAQVPVISFEPNPSCSAQFQTLCELNGFSGRWEGVAIGSEDGEIELVYPERDTWLGSVSSNVVSTLRGAAGMTSMIVPVKRLDSYIGEIPDGRILMKIDVEGHECSVLEGASRLLRERGPSIVFESNDAGTRGDLYGMLAGFGYQIHRLQWGPDADSQTMSVDEFVVSGDTNFIAVPEVEPGL